MDRDCIKFAFKASRERSAPGVARDRKKTSSNCTEAYAMTQRHSAAKEIAEQVPASPGQRPRVQPRRFASILPIALIPILNQHGRQPYQLIAHRGPAFVGVNVTFSGSRCQVAGPQAGVGWSARSQVEIFFISSGFLPATWATTA